MSENCSQRPVTAMAMSPWLWWTGLFLLLALGPTSALLSQEFPPAGPQYFSSMGDAISDSYEAQSGFLYSPLVTGRTGQSFGAMMRGGYLTGPTVGRDKGIAPLEIMPYAFIGDGMFLADIRGFRGDRGDFGANMGLGYRQFIAPWDRIFGVNFFYDIDNTTSYTFNQLGFGIETLGELWDARANAYFPYGDRDVFIANALVDGSQHFVGHQLLYDVRNAFQSSLKGADAEIGFPLPGPFATLHDIRIFGGGYYYETADSLKFAGGSARLQGNVIPSVQLQLQVTHDDQFKTNVMFGAQLAWGGFQPDRRERPSQWSRMTTPIQRQYTISTTRTYVVVDDVVAFNRSTGQPYFFNHVESATSVLSDGTVVPYNTDPFAVRNGTVEHPYLSIAEAEARDPAQPGDIIFVHADSQYNGETVTMQQGLATPNGTQELSIRYLGNGTDFFNGNKFEVSHIITVPDVGIVQLPTLNDGPGDTPIYNVNEPVIQRGDRPLFTNGVGNGVTADSFAEFSGFQVGNQDLLGSGPTGHGLFGNAVEFLQLNQNVFAYAGLDGMRFENALSDIDIIDTNIINPDGVGLRIIGGSPGLTFGSSDPTNLDLGLIQNQPALPTRPTYSLAILDTQAGTNIDLTNSTILNGVVGNGSVDGGILILRTAGDITVGRATINSPQDSGILVQGVVGQVNFVRTLNILNRQDIGIELRGNAGRIVFDATTDNGVVDGGVNITWSGVGTGAAISWQNNDDDLTTPIQAATIFDVDVPITILGSGGAGFDLGTEAGGGNTGNFIASGDVTIAQNATGGPFNIQGVGINISQNDGVIQFNRRSSSETIISDREQQGILIQNNIGPVSFLSNTTVNNEQASLINAVEITGNTRVTGIVRFDTLDINDAQQVTVGVTEASLDAGIDHGAALSVYDNPAAVQINTLNTNGTVGISVYALNVTDPTDADNSDEGLIISAGQIIDNTELPAISIVNSVYGVVFDEVNSADSTLQGIRLLNNTGRDGARWDFQVLNRLVIDPFAGQSTLGGTIENATLQGVYAENSGAINLNYMVIQDNGEEGVESIANEELRMFGNEVIDNTASGLRALNTPIISVAGDPREFGIINFDSNGTDEDLHNQIRLISTVVDNTDTLINEWTLADLQIIHDLPSAAVLVTSRDEAGNLGHSELELIALRNNIEVQVPGTDVVFIPTAANLDPDFNPTDPSDLHRTAMGLFALWNGSISSNSLIDSNQISITGGSIGIAVRALSDDDTDRVILDVTNNVIDGIIGNNVGIYFDSEFTNSTLLTISGNEINLEGSAISTVTNSSTFEVGIFIENLDRQSNVTIQDNTGTITSQNAVAVGFNRVFGWGDFRGLTRAPATYNISGNDFTLSALFPNTDETLVGFVLGTPVGGRVTLNSITENTITFPNSQNGVLVVPQTSTAFEGQINVNGQLFPQ